MIKLLAGIVVGMFISRINQEETFRVGQHKWLFALHIDRLKCLRRGIVCRMGVVWQVLTYLATDRGFIPPDELLGFYSWKGSLLMLLFYATLQLRLIYLQSK